MQKIFLLLLSIALTLSMPSCSKLELDESETATKSDEDKGEVADTIQTYEGDYCKVENLEMMPDDSVVAVKCYIVGYMPGRTVKNTIFNVEYETRSTTNIVIADIANENLISQCATVQLQANSAAQQKLNLQDNPDKWRAQVVLIGTKGTYNYSVGLRNVSQYYLLQKASEDEEDPDTGNEEEPENPSRPAYIPALPTQLDDEGEVFEGC